MNKNAENNDQNIGADHDDQGKVAENENERDYLVNALKNGATLSIGNVEGMRDEEKTMINYIIEVAEHNLY